jgi:hypothetical protein
METHTSGVPQYENPWLMNADLLQGLVPNISTHEKISRVQMTITSLFGRYLLGTECLFQEVRCPDAL